MNDEFERRLTALERPERLALPLRSSDFWMMMGVALILPAAMLTMAWGW